MGSKQSTTSGTSTSDDTSSSTQYPRDYRTSDATESTNDDRTRTRARTLAELLDGNSHSSVIHHRQSGLESFFNPFSVRSSTSSYSHNNHDNSIPELEFAHSLPGYLLFPHNFIKCPFCSKTIMPDDAEVHLVMCITKPQLTYNEDILTEDKGECVICLEEMLSGNKIARLPCLCIYHKLCIDNWFQVNRSCPEHPSDD